MVKRLRKNERGIALLAVMLGIALMMLLVVDFATSAEFGFIAAANQANELRSYYLARSGVNIGLAVLAQDIRNQTLMGQPLVDSLGSPWAQPFSADVEGGKIQLSIIDEDRKINLNSIVSVTPNGPVINPKAVAQVMQLLGIVFTENGIKAEPQEITCNIVAWLGQSCDNLNSGPNSPTAALTASRRGSEGLSFGLNGPAMRGEPMPTIGDLMNVPGVTEAIFNALRPFVTTVSGAGQMVPGATTPPGTPQPPTTPQASGNGCTLGVQVNINTAPPEVIAALEPDLLQQPDMVKEIVLARMATGPLVGGSAMGGGAVAQGQPSPVWMELTTALPCLGQDVIQNGRSSFFTITGAGSYAGSRKIVDATFKRQPTGQGMLVSWRER